MLHNVTVLSSGVVHTIPCTILLSIASRAVVICACCSGPAHSPAAPASPLQSVSQEAVTLHRQSTMQSSSSVVSVSHSPQQYLVKTSFYKVFLELRDVPSGEC